MHSSSKSNLPPVRPGLAQRAAAAATAGRLAARAEALAARDEAESDPEQRSPRRTKRQKMLISPMIRLLERQRAYRRKKLHNRTGGRK